MEIRFSTCQNLAHPYTFGFQISRRPGSPELMQQVNEIARNNANNAPGFAFGKDKKVKPHLKMISTIKCRLFTMCLVSKRSW